MGMFQAEIYLTSTAVMFHNIIKIACKYVYNYGYIEY